MLEAYRAKRDFKVTAEPEGGKAQADGDAFVIQKHAARRLHYDLRLELDGVMKSWALAKGPSLVPGEKRLAVQVEDHPIEYNEFEGTIPKGEYGGGTVMIWDRGRWTPDGDPRAGYAKGHLDFSLDGEKLRGKWHLVRMKKRPGERQEPWLLIKAGGEAGRTADDPDILEEKSLSVATGRSLDEIAAAAPSKRPWSGQRDAQWSSNGTPASRAAARAAAAATEQAGLPAAPGDTAKDRGKQPAKAEAKGRPSRAKRPAAEPGRGAGGAPLPDFVPPCLATLSDAPPESDGWVHEVKFDGYRIEARLDHGAVALKTRKGLDWTDRFRRVARAVATIRAQTALLDGEVVVETQAGVSSFTALQQELKTGGENFTFYAFDLLHRDGRDLMPAPLAERKAELNALLASLPADAAVKLSEDFTSEGALLLKHACRLGLEGVVSKLRDAPYRPGRSADWVKSKCADRQEFVVIGYAPSSVDPKAVGALILGYHADGKLQYAGRVGTGFTRKTAREMWERLEPLRADAAPIKPLPKEERAGRGARWVEPRVVVEIDFRGWTGAERIRQGSFKGVREDKPASEVVRESGAQAMEEPRAQEPASPPPADGKAKRKAKTKASAGAKPAAKAAPAEIGAVRLTHPDRVYWDDVGLTKQGLADYYVAIWDWVAPHLVARPLSLVRCPEGASAQCFFQKHASAGLGSKHLHLTPDVNGDAISVDDRDGLIALVQAGVLEIHVRGTSIDHLEDCNRIVFDLDPGPEVDWPVVVQAARDVRARLAALGLASYVKTSGGKGLHVVLPIAYAPWDQAKDFARSIAHAMAADDPARYTAVIAKRERTGRVFVDYLRNSREQTAIAPYSTRARAGASVSAPVSWEELAKHAGGNHYTVANLPKRLARLRHDPWAGIAEQHQDLPPPLKGRWSR